MKAQSLIVPLVMAAALSVSCGNKSGAEECAPLRGAEKAAGKLPMSEDGIVRLSKIEVHPESLAEYLRFAEDVGEASMLTEPGVLVMYAMQDKEAPCRVTILEIYASREAYKSHIASPHFRKYKQGTLRMVKSLELCDQRPLNPRNVISGRIAE